MTIVNSSFPFWLSTLPKNIERHVFNSVLLLLEYRDKLVLIDWKTSEKPKPFLSNTYDTPIQIAAYVGALNADPQYNMKVAAIIMNIIWIYLVVLR